MTAPTPALQVRRLNKSFAANKVLQDVDFVLQPGEIHALVGENGAGKSTLMKILYGQLKSDSGEVSVFGKNLAPMEKSKEIGMVHQHFMLAPALTALDHVVVQYQSRYPGLKPVPRDEMRSQMQKLSNELSMPVPWDKPVQELSVGICQRLEILRLLFGRAQILIFDEPTAVLTPQETEDFLRRLLDLKKRGHSIILISHKLKEVLQVSDRISVLRSGKIVESRSNWTLAALGEAMVGRPLPEIQPFPRAQEFVGITLLDINGIGGGLNLTLEKGEILGIAGIEGNGQEQLIDSLIDPSRISTGTIRWNNSISWLGKSNAEVRRLGVGYLPDDRHHKAILLKSSLGENYFLGQQDLFTRGSWWIDQEKIHTHVMSAKQRLSIKMSNETQEMWELSGGNQQKIVFARETERKLNLLIAHQPTRGVDLGAAATIYENLQKLKLQGTSVLLISSDLDEILQNSDRIAVIASNRITGTWSRDEIAKNPRAMEILGLAMGAH